jgi:DNA-binding MarR family transcriptional regulator
MQLLSVATKRTAAGSAVSPRACAEELLDALPPVMRFVRKHMRSHRAKGLSVPQFRTLALLRSAPATNLSAVAEFLGSSLSTTSRIVSGLVEKGFIRRCERAGDRRNVELALTPRGAAAVETSRRATMAQLAGELATLNESDRTILLRAMQSLHTLFAPGLRRVCSKINTIDHANGDQ